MLQVYQELTLRNVSTGDTDEGNAAEFGLLWLQSLVSRVLMEHKGVRITSENNTEVLLGDLRFKMFVQEFPQRSNLQIVNFIKIIFPVNFIMILFMNLQATMIQVND